MKLVNTLLTLLSATVLIISCTKKKEENTQTNPPSTKKQILESGKWQISSSTATATYMGKDSTINLYNLMDECEKDDFIEFSSNGTGTVNENTNVCSGNQQIATFSWELLNNDTKMSIVDNNPDTVDIAELTSTQMRLKLTSSNSSGTPITTDVTYKNIK